MRPHIVQNDEESVSTAKLVSKLSRLFWNPNSDKVAAACLINLRPKAAALAYAISFADGLKLASLKKTPRANRRRNFDLTIL
jgi:hypothetical protein